MIELRNVSKIYQMGDQEVHALRKVSLKIEDGDFVAIMGPSGSGKSSLAHILGLLDVPTEGSYLLNGLEVSALSEDDLAILRREEIGFIFQQFNLLPRISAKENVALPSMYSRKEGSEELADSLLDVVGLGARKEHKPKELSGGQQQRVAIARALLNKPRMILADEPTGNLDSKSEREIMAKLRELNEQGITVIMVTHEEEIGQQAKRLIRMRDGVIQSDVRHENFAKPAPATKKADYSPPPFFSELRGHFRQGFNTLAANKVRTALSMLGILIGVAAVVTMLALGRGAQIALEAQLASLGSNLLVLRTGSVRVDGVTQSVGSTSRLTLNDANALKESLPGIRRVAPIVQGRVQITHLSEDWNTEVNGVTSSWASMHAAQPVIGRFFTEAEEKKRTRVAVVGQTIVRQLFKGKNPVGLSLRINKIPFQVVGVMPSKGVSGFQDQDDKIVIPLSTAMFRVLGRNYVDALELEVTDREMMSSMEKRVKNVMIQRHRVPATLQGQAFQVYNMAELQSTLTESSRTMSILLASIAAISLIVGGIGITNIMIVSVTERTKEIGLRKAIGARRRDIMMQFLTESVVVSIIGGLAGIVLGWGSTIIVNEIAGWATSISVGSVLLAFGFSAMVGILFGIYPARQASRLHPIEALRYE